VLGDSDFNDFLDGLLFLCVAFWFVPLITKAREINIIFSYTTLREMVKGELTCQAALDAIGISDGLLRTYETGIVSDKLFVSSGGISVEDRAKAFADR